MSKTNTGARAPKHVFYPENTQGRDFIVGDLHGCVADLLKMLQLIKFDSAVDRLFSVGDLVDRGPDSFRTAELVYEPWFFAVKGNHEELMYETILRESFSHAGTWFSNGGQWGFEHDAGEMKNLARALELLPYVISVGEGANRFNIVHGELKHCENWTRVPMTDAMLDNWVFSDSEEGDLLWGRTLISNGKEKIADVQPDEFWHDMEKLSLTYVGHTPVREVVQVQKQMYIDTGAVFHHTNKLTSRPETCIMTIACHTEKQLYQYNMLWRTVATIPYADIEKLG